MDKLIQYCEKIDELTTFVDNILTKKGSKTKSDDQPNAFFFVLSLKTNNSLRTANLLLVNVTNHVYFCDSIFILLRTMLSDAITHFYLLAKAHNAPDPDKVLTEHINILAGDHVYYLDKSLKIYEKLYNDDPRKIGKMKSEIRQKYPEYFNRDQGHKHKPPNIGGMVMSIVDSGSPELLSMVTTAYERYDVYSKIEHLGMFTTQLVTRQYYVENHSDILRDINLAIYSVLTSLCSSIAGTATTKELEQLTQKVGEILAIKMYE